MNDLEVQKWNYLNEDKFHMLEVSKKLKEYAFSIDDNAIKTLKENGQKYKMEHYSSELEKNVYWYGAKIYIIKALDRHCMGSKRNLIARSPELASGMFMKLADTFNYTDADYFYPRLFIYDMAADFIQYYEKTRNEELNKNLVKEFFMFFSEYLVNSIDDDKVKYEHTRWLDEISFSIEDEYVSNNKTNQLYFAYGSNMDKIQMDYRCPGAVPLAICKKLNYRTILNTRGVATIIPQEGSISYGILWRVTNDHIETLDRYEGVSSGFYKKVNSSVMVDGYQYPSLVYIADDDQIGRPSRLGYLDTLLRGIEYFNGHKQWYEEIEKLGYV